MLPGHALGSVWGEGGALELMVGELVRRVLQPTLKREVDGAAERLRVAIEELIRVHGEADLPAAAWCQRRGVRVG